jgi:hypothetical protein
MKPPIIYLSQGDVLMFASIQSAQSYIEPTYTRNCLLYDSEGRLLECEIDKKSHGLLWSGGEEVRITVDSEDPIHKLELRVELISFFIGNPQFGQANESIFARPLDELIEMVNIAKGYTG